MIKDLSVIVMVVCSLLLIGVKIGYELHEPECPEYIFDMEYKIHITKDFQKWTSFDLPTNVCGPSILITKEVEEDECIGNLDDCT